MAKLNEMASENIVKIFQDETPIGSRSTFVRKVINQITPTTKNELILLEVIKLMETRIDIALRATGEIEDHLAETYQIYVGDYYQGFYEEEQS